MKCIPFSTHTAVPILEGGLERMHITRFVGEQQTSTKGEAINLAFQSLKRATSSRSRKRADYDLRMLLRFYHTDGTKETFYVDWDRKGLLHNNQFYLIGQEELGLIGKAFECDYCFNR